MAQLVTRIDQQLADAIDALVDQGVVASRSEAVRTGLEQFIDTHHRAQIAREIVDAYTRDPQTEDELGFSDAAAARMIAEEPW
ncbi:MAG: ribbon-helix-helix domain-containing protein [Acidimicrobiia bacterium]